MGRKSLKTIYREKLLKEARKKTPKLLYVVSYDIPGSTPAIRMKLSRHVQALMEVSKELGFLCERRTWSCFLCDERTMPVLNELLLSLGCKPDIFPVALNLTVVERHLVEALRKLENYKVKEAKEHIKAALKELRGEPYIPVYIGH
ncbi:MAG: hypothetical protein DRJ66_01820 [Thermoprotei archaeon]|nr:MAG: hypothetical protein DRJ66_01820 [Thermoprotei archaeon]RLF19244.1 MAG: hypothetical protein DRZ82_06435 [Thermoprotei archaeon]